MEYKLSSDTWDNKEIEAISRVITSGRYTMGNEVKSFEERFADFFEVKNAVMTNSGSSANLIAIAALRYHPKFKNKINGNIIVPTVSWSTTFFPVHQLGYKLKFVDVNVETFNIDIAEVEKNIDENTVAIFAVNLLGNPCELKQLLSLCEKKEIVLIEDNCESLGACLDGKQAGTYGEMGTYSFFFSHHLQTMEGGMVVTNDDTLADYLRSLRAHGWIRNDENNTFNKTGNQFEDSFKFVLPGYCVRPLEFSGAVGQEQLKKWPKMLSQRRLNAETAKKIFQNSDKIFLQQETGESSWFGFGLILTGNLEGKRREVINELQKSGVECRPIVAGNFTKNPVIKYLNCEALSEYPAAEKIDKDGFFIGNDSIDLTEKISYAYKIINSVV
jgi:CDP-6-deoxy-D-xylo-4-hexulose-3-dehydrase